jgi:type I restriction enzyme R subunit
MQFMVGAGREMQSTPNFGFLAVHDAKLVQLGVLAEHYFHSDPATAIIKLRQLAELISKVIAARHAIYERHQETFEIILRRLSWEGIIPKEIADTFHKLGKVGNRAVYEDHG